MNIVALPAFNDNYIWTLHNSKAAVVVDPGDANVVLRFLADNELSLTAVLLTHHHADHSGGINTLLTHFPDIKVFGSRTSKLAEVNAGVSEGETIHILEMGLNFNVLEVPGHTLDHIAFYSDQRLFCGDSLFSLGCGRLFEGTANQAYDSLQKMARLPAQTQIYCTHEYTAANLVFALAVEPDNRLLQRYKLWVERQRQHNIPTLPTTLAEQLAMNPFLRCHEPDIIRHIQAREDKFFAGGLDVFTALRSYKDHF